MKLAVLTCDTHTFLLKGFAYLFNKYWSDGQLVDIYGTIPPSFPLPSNFRFTELSRAYPFEQWTDSVLEMMRLINEDQFIFMLEDYWLTEQVNLDQVKFLYTLMQSSWLDRKVLRVDLTADRASQRNYPVYAARDLHIIETVPGSPYQMSFQAAIWNKKLLQKVLIKGENAHEAELDGSIRLGFGYKVYGTTEWPVKYRPVYRFRRHDFNYQYLSEADKAIITEMYP